MPVVQVPPAVGTSGQFIDAIIITSSTLRQVNVIGDSVTSGIFAPVTSSGGLRVSMSSGTVTLSSAIAISSGLVTMSSVQTVTATAGTNPWSSAPGFNVPIVSVSSGLVQVLTSGTLVVDARRGNSPLFATINVSSSGANTLVSASVGNKVKVYNIFLIADTSNTISLGTSATAGAIVSSMLLSTAGVGLVNAGDVSAWVMETTGTNNALVMTLGNAGGIRGALAYFLES